ncbi:MAG: DinB family protein [Candidatus Dormibacteraeota bacterium]|nr:DinB family protein [Candidatus Dormibacteraeota bacterium]
MKNESAGFGRHELAGFLDQQLEHERKLLVARLERASSRLVKLGARVSVGARPGPGDAWSAHDVLAHIAVLSHFYGMLAYRTGTGALPEFDLLPLVRGRDAAGQQTAELDQAEIVRQARQHHERTLTWLRSATPADLRRTCNLGEGLRLTAEDLVRLPLIAHLEEHLDQLEKQLAVHQ